MDVGGQVAPDEPAEDDGGNDGGNDLRHAKAEDDAPHGEELGQGKFEPDGKHQEDDAELGQGMAGFVFRRQAQRVGADDDANGQVAQHGRQMQHSESDHAQHGAAE